jgi:hypothetical protein
MQIKPRLHRTKHCWIFAVIFYTFLADYLCKNLVTYFCKKNKLTFETGLAWNCQSLKIWYTRKLFYSNPLRKISQIFYTNLVILYIQLASFIFSQFFYFYVNEKCIERKKIIRQHVGSKEFNRSKNVNAKILALLFSLAKFGTGQLFAKVQFGTVHFLCTFSQWLTWCTIQNLVYI